MKVLHIGNKDSALRYTKESEFTKNTQWISVAKGLPVQTYPDAARDADVIVADAITEVSASLIEAMPNLKLIHSEGVAYNRIDLKSAGERGVFVCNCAGVNAEAVAEQTVFLMVGVLHDVLGNDRAVREGRQIQVKEAYMSQGNLLNLSDCKIGLIGFGNIGKSTAHLLKAYGAQVFYTKRRREEEQTEQEYNVSWVETRDDLLASCDIISLHVPVTPETQKMCNNEFFGKMRPGSYLINTSRGELVDDEALAEALKSGRLAMAGLDTLDFEPVQKDHFLLNQPDEVKNKILFSPHIAGITGSCFRKSYAIIWENIKRIAESSAPENIVNAEFLKKGGLKI